MQTKVQDIMKKNPETIAPDASLQEVAEKMRAVDCGVLPVGTKDKPVGIITDRDIVVRAVAVGKDIAREKVSDYMTQDVFYCREQDTLEQAAEQMHRHHVNRLLVRDQSGAMAGILTFGCILRKDSSMDDIHRVLKHTVGKKAA